MRVLILFLISFSAAAGYYAPVAEVEKKILDCNYPLEVSKKCSNNCIAVDKTFNCETGKIVNEEIDDYSKPVNSKTIVNECGDYCQSLFDTDYKDYKCVDADERLILNLDTKQIYCSKILRYEKKLSGKKIIIDDVDKKAAYDLKILKKTTMAAKKARGAVSRQKCKDALDYIAGGNLDSEMTEEQIDLMMASFEPIFKALQNNRPGKALRLINLVTDPAHETLKNDLIEILE